MKFAISSDWHSDWVTMGISRFAEIEKAVMQSVQTAIEEKCDWYFFLGDLCDPDSGGRTFQAQNLAVRTALRLQRAGIPSIWLAGNHDVTDNERDGAFTTIAPMRALSSKIHVIEKPRVVTLSPTVEAFCLPYPSTKVDMVEFLAKEESQLDDASSFIVLSHLSIPGMHPGSETLDMPRGLEVSYPFEATKNAKLRMCGHYHRQQSFDPHDGGPPIIIPGALARLSFGEESNEPGFLIIDL